MRFGRENRFTYVEGAALRFIPGPMAFDHAWCIDGDDNIHEVTWEHPGLAYFGVPFSWSYIDCRCANEREGRHGNGSLLTSNGREPLLSGDETDRRPQGIDLAGCREAMGR